MVRIPRQESSSVRIPTSARVTLASKLNLLRFQVAGLRVLHGGDRHAVYGRRMPGVALVFGFIQVVFSESQISMDKPSD